MNKSLFYLLLLTFVPVCSDAQLVLFSSSPNKYICYRTTDEIILDGDLHELSWEKVKWTDDFVDIEGSLKPNPTLSTRVKMLWDDDYLYIAAELEEPNIWATFTDRESVIFHENNFEVFIDPDGDTHNYYELEINALGTIWDLLLTKPYKNWGIPISTWNIDGFKYGIEHKGTINNPGDRDTSWIVEMAFPWSVLQVYAYQKRKPNHGEQWRINFSRVQWKLVVVDGKYQKTLDPTTGKPYPEYNWVWSPQWIIDMHLPELWGYVQFSALRAGEKDEFVIYPDEHIKYKLRELYYLQKSFWTMNGRFAESLHQLDNLPDDLADFRVSFEVGKTRFKLSSKSSDEKSTWHITEDSRIWRE